MGCCNVVRNASRSLVITRSLPLKFRLSSKVRSSTCVIHYKKKNGVNEIKQEQIHSSSLLERFIKTTRSVNRFYKRTFPECVPSSMLVWPERGEETDEAIHYIINMTGVLEEDIKISVEKNKTVTIIGEGDAVFEATKGFKKCVCYVDLPDIDSPVKMYTTRGIKANMRFNAGTVELIIPKLKQHEKQDDANDQQTTFNVKINRTFREKKLTKVWNNEEEDDDDEYEEEYCDCNKSYLSSFYASIGSLMELVRLPPIINKCVNISSQRFLSTIGDGNRHRLNLAIHSISNFIYTDIMNRFGLFDERVYCFSATRIKPSSEENDEFLYYYLQMKEVVSHEKLTVCSDNNQIVIKGAVHDEFKATSHICACFIYLQPEDSWYLKYNTSDIKADFSQGEGGVGKLKLTIPKFDAAQRMINDKKNEAGEFSNLRDDAFCFDYKVNAS